MTYAEAVAILAKSRDKRSKKLENNTYLVWTTEDSISIRLHSTDAVTMHADGSYTLNSGGWRTVTTKDRINKYSPVCVYSNKGVWYCGPRGMHEPCESLPFFDGMIVNVNGYCQNPPKKSAVEKQESNKRKLDKATRAYIKAFAADALTKGFLQKPSGGDCWGCLMKPEGHDPAGNGFNCTRVFDVKAENPMGVSHILQHIGLGKEFCGEEESELYFVPSLLLNAILAQGCGTGGPGFHWHMMESDLKESEHRKPSTDFLERTLRGYFRRLKPALLEEMSRMNVNIVVNAKP